MRCASSHAEFRLYYQAYLENFGDRCLEELKLESETLDENPMVLLRSVGELARGSPPASQQEDAPTPISRVTPKRRFAPVCAVHLSGGCS